MTRKLAQQYALFCVFMVKGMVASMLLVLYSIYTLHCFIIGMMEMKFEYAVQYEMMQDV